jgi:hypothetical protein
MLRPSVNAIQAMIAKANLLFSILNIRSEFIF